MPFLTTTKQLFAELESTAGVSIDPTDKANSYASPTLQDVRVRSLEFTVTPERDDENSKYLNGDFSGDESISGKINSTAKFTMKAEPAYYKAGVSATHKINFSKFLESCGMMKIVVRDPVPAALTDIDYPIQYCYYPSVEASTNTITLTELAINEDKTGIAKEIRGAIGNFKIMADGTGKPLTMEFSYTGSTDEDGVWEIDHADVENLGFDVANVSTLPAEKYVNTSITLTNLDTSASSTFCSSTMSFDSGNTISTIDCQNTSSGITSSMIDEMNPRFVMAPLAQTLGNFNFWSSLTNQEKYSIDVIVDTTVANIPPIRLIIPRAEMITASDTENGKKIAHEMTFRPLSNIDKTLPPLKYYEQADGTVNNFSFAGSSVIDNEQGATWFLMFGEREA